MNVIKTDNLAIRATTNHSTSLRVNRIGSHQINVAVLFSNEKLVSSLI